MAADRDARYAEREHDVDQQGQGEPAVPKGDPAVVGHHDQRAKHTEAGPGRTDRERAGLEQQRPERPGEQRCHVDRDEVQAADRRLQDSPQDVQEEHVERDVQQAVVQKAGCQDPPVLVALSDGRTVEPTLEQDGAGLAAAQRQATRHLGDERDHVDRDQHLGGPRRRGHRSERPDLRALPRAFRAAHPDGCRRHAVRAYGPATRGARDAGLARGMAVADGHGAVTLAAPRAASAWLRP